MSEQTKNPAPSTPPASTPPVEDKNKPTLKQLIDLVNLKIRKIKMFQLGNVELGDITKGESKVEPRFIGKPGHNPYLYLAQVVQPIEQAIELETVTEQQLNEFLKLPDEVVPDGKAIKPVNVTLRQQFAALSKRTQ